MKLGRIKLKSKADKYSLFLFLLIVVISFNSGFNFKQVDNQMIKSAYVYHLSTYVKWENLPLDNEFLIAVIGKTGDGKIVIPNTKKILGRNVRVIKANDVEQAERLGCRVVFLCADQQYQLPYIYSYVANKKILTICANREFLNNGMMVNLYQEEGKVAFELNQKAIKNGNIKMSSQIYSLAKRVLK